MEILYESQLPLPPGQCQMPKRASVGIGWDQASQWNRPRRCTRGSDYPVPSRPTPAAGSDSLALCISTGKTGRDWRCRGVGRERTATMGTQGALLQLQDPLAGSLHIQ